MWYNTKDGNGWINWKLHFIHCGCKVNKYETNLLREKFEEKGYEVVLDDEKADIYCINTCTVTNMSDRKTRQAISRMRKQNPNSVIAVLGCYAESLKNNNTMPYADCIIGNDDKNRTVEIIEKCLENKEKKYYHIIDMR